MSFDLGDNIGIEIYAVLVWLLWLQNLEIEKQYALVDITKYSFLKLYNKQLYEISSFINYSSSM